MKRITLLFVHSITRPHEKQDITALGSLISERGNSSIDSIKMFMVQQAIQIYCLCLGEYLNHFNLRDVVCLFVCL